MRNVIAAVAMAAVLLFCVFAICWAGTEATWFVLHTLRDMR